MNRIITAAVAAATIAIALPAAASAASLAPYRSVNARVAELDRRLDAGVRNGSITRSEAERLRSGFRGLEAREARYRATGGRIDARERADLDRGIAELANRIDAQRHDAQSRR